MKHILKLLLAAVLLLGQIPNTVFAQEVKGGFVLTPNVLVENAVDTNSTFTLVSPSKLSAEDFTLAIDGEQPPVITPIKDKEFLITPQSPLESNRLYTFRLQLHNKDEITWVFQTAMEFAISQVFPAHTSINVPVNTGIEITFNYAGYEDLEKYFSISPSVKGSFEKYGNTTAFVPKSLKQETIYTVTIKKGVALSNTQKKLSSDYVFQFETEGKSQEDPPDKPLLGYYDTFYGEYSTVDIPEFSFSLIHSNYKSEETKAFQVSSTVYSFPSAKAFTEAHKGLENAPYWSRFNHENNLIKTDRLKSTLTFQHGFSSTKNYQSHTLKLPSKLSPGYYLLDSYIGNTRFQTAFQVTDITSYLQLGTDSVLLWANDMIRQKPIHNAKVQWVDSNEIYRTNEYGIAEFPLSFSAEEVNTAFLEITAANGQSSIIMTHSYGQNKDLYWRYLELDRTLYQPQDTVAFWGMAKNRYQEEEIGELTVEVSQPYYYRSWWIPEKPIIKETISVQDNVFEGTLKLPYLAAGYYNLAIKKGKEVLSSSYIQVQQYVKPTYQITVTPDKKAVFEGEEIYFDIKMNFFDGTPLPHQQVDCSLYNWYSSDSQQDEITLDANGRGTFSYTVPQTERTELSYINFSARAVSPELSNIFDTAMIQVYAADRDLSVSSKFDEDSRPYIEAAVHEVDFSKINNGEGYDSKGEVVAGQKVSGTIYHNFYTKEETGSYYDKIDKVTKPVYEYTLQKNKVYDMEIFTESDGIARYYPTLSEPDEGYYSVELHTADKQGKTVTSHVYYLQLDSRNKTFYHPNEQYYHLAPQFEQETFKIGEKAEFLFQKNDEVLEAGTFLYLKAQNGILDYEIQDSAKYSLSFLEEYVPSVYVKGVCFNGITYYETHTETMKFDYSSQKLNLEVTTDKEIYAPGDTCTITVKAKKPNGKLAQSSVNISIVDEALFSLSDYQADILDTLYYNVMQGLFGSYISHQSSGQIFARSYNQMAGGGDGGAAPTANAKEFASATMEDSDGMVRENFKDTAGFITVKTDQKGIATHTFTLPHNITSWRMTLSAVTGDLYAATLVQNIKVSQPFFVSYTLNDTFLKGDIPSIMLSGFGDGLGNDEEIIFEVSSENHPERTVTGTGTALVRKALPLWEINEDDTLLITAKTAKGAKDSVRHPIKAIETHHEIKQSVYQKLTENTVLTGGAKELTNITFIDQSQGAWLSQIMQLSYVTGVRIDQQLSRKISYELIQKYGDDALKAFFSENPAIKLEDYQSNDGGIKLFPYGESDLNSTVKLLPYLLDGVDQTELKAYLYEKMGDPTAKNHTPNAKVLYGLSILKEPVLLQLEKIAQTENIAALDLIYCGLSYMELGETAIAQKLYEERILPMMEDLSPYMRIPLDTDSNTLEATASAAVLASRLNAPQKDGLFLYAANHYSDELYIAFEKIMFIANEIEHTDPQPCKITYSLFGEEHEEELKNGRLFTVTLPSQNLDQLKILNTSGNAAVISTFNAPLHGFHEQSSDIALTRNYSLYGSDNPQAEFGVNDIIKVNICVTFGENSLQGHYEVTDYLPAGLEFIGYDQPLYHVLNGNYYADNDGSKVRFHTYHPSNEPTVFSYYARVSSPGRYIADGSIVQNTIAGGVMRITSNQILTLLGE